MTTDQTTAAEQAAERVARLVARCISEALEGDGWTSRLDGLGTIVERDGVTLWLTGLPEFVPMVEPDLGATVVFVDDGQRRVGTVTLRGPGFIRAEWRSERGIVHDCVVMSHSGSRGTYHVVVDE